tara:strand:+ start:5374 stop:6243 length:870 start_codon:yes stop_codon:yes gene_type:complete
MPELPEVEVVRRSLSNFISGVKINKVNIFNSNLRFKISKNLKKNVESQKITSISRRAKFLLIKLQNNKVILIHLGMTGKIFMRNKKKESTLVTSFYFDKQFSKKHNHLILYLDNSIELIYNDVRKFGFIKVIEFNQLNSNQHLSKLGPEPFSKKFNYNYLLSVVRKSKKNVKNFMMDQKYISGLGNIYANEILFYSSINPSKLANKLSNGQVAKIILNTRKVLKSSIQLGGSSIRDFNTVSGKKGKYQDRFMVYDRVNKLCRKKNCKGRVKKIYISNRSTFFCDKCQNN